MRCSGHANHAGFSAHQLARLNSFTTGDLGLQCGDQACTVGQRLRASLHLIAIKVAMTGLGICSDSCMHASQARIRLLIADYMRQMI